MGGVRCTSTMAHKCVSEDNLKLVALSHLSVVPRTELGSSSDLLGNVFPAEPSHWST